MKPNLSQVVISGPQYTTCSNFTEARWTQERFIYIFIYINNCVIKTVAQYKCRAICKYIKKK